MLDLRRVSFVPLTLVLLGLTASCGAPAAREHALSVRTVRSEPIRWDTGPIRRPEPTTTTASTTTTVPLPPPTPTTVVHRVGGSPLVNAPGDYTSVLECIKAHESGDYSSNTHGPNGSSGAYQIIGPTWRAWSARAGYPDYSAAFLAPAAVQDAVALFMLEHGGAHDWDPRFGDDPCTVNLP